MMPRCSSLSSFGSTSVWQTGSAFDLTVLDARPGFLLFRAAGKSADVAFANEGGGHRWQRVPPSEKRGRVHTSTVTVVVLPEPREHEIRIDDRDLDEAFTRGSGAGGQHRNKTDSCVLLTHKPTGIKVRIDGGRSQHINRQTALAVLRARLKAGERDRASKGRNASRRAQVGSGMRGDKRRTIALQRDSVTDHALGTTTTWKRYSRGFVSDLWS
jgi:peptide chain release factor 1